MNLTHQFNFIWVILIKESRLSLFIRKQCAWITHNHFEMIVFSLCPLEHYTNPKASDATHEQHLRWIIRTSLLWKKKTNRNRGEGQREEKKDYVSCMYVCIYVCMYYVHMYVYVWTCIHENRCPWKLGKCAGSPGAAKHGCWELNLGPLQEQHPPLTTEPSLHTQMSKLY